MDSKSDNTTEGLGVSKFEAIGVVRLSPAIGGREVLEDELN
jgi:hypothetical protein